jgi:hypothetical protein
MAEDRFSKQSESYATFRPEYPKELFEFIISKTQSQTLCWDCATGNGQAARSLSKYFKNIVATDLSADQIKFATGPKNISFRVDSAESARFESNSLDLITIAQALHWFNFDNFYMHAKQFLKPQSIIAAWGYDFFSVNAEIDAILDPYGREFLKPYWSERNWLLINGYRDIPFPFRRIETPDLYLKVNWDLNHVRGFLNSWSASQKYKDINNCDPYESIREKLEKAWTEGSEVKPISWKLYLLVGENSNYI